MSDSVMEYLTNAFRSREEDVSKLLAGDALEDGGDAQEELDEYPLSVEVERHLVVTISTGGPHEEIDAILDGDGDVTRATFGAYWGGQRIETNLNPGDALYRWVEQLAETVAQ